MRWTWIPIRTSFIIQSANTNTFSLSGTMILWFMVLEARLSFHKGHTEKDLDFLKLRETSPLKDQTAREPEHLVRSICQSICHFTVPFGAIKEKVYQTSTTIEPITGRYTAFKEVKKAKTKCSYKLQLLAFQIYQMTSNFTLIGKKLQKVQCKYASVKK